MLNSMLEGKFIVLSHLTKEELPLLLSLYEEPEFMDDFGYIDGVVQTYESLCTWYEQLAESQDEVFYSIYERTTMSWIGFISLMDLNEIEKEGWLVIGLTKEKRGKGLGKECLTCLIQEAFSKDIEVIRLSVLCHNERAIRLYKSVGFKIEMIYPKRTCPNFFDVDILELSLSRADIK